MRGAGRERERERKVMHRPPLPVPAMGALAGAVIEQKEVEEEVEDEHHPYRCPHHPPPPQTVVRLWRWGVVGGAVGVGAVVVVAREVEEERAGDCGGGVYLADD